LKFYKLLTNRKWLYDVRPNKQENYKIDHKYIVKTLSKTRVDLCVIYITLLTA